MSITGNHDIIAYVIIIQVPQRAVLVGSIAL